MFGAHGKVLRVNLSESTVSEEAIPEGLYDQFLTGAGLATHYLYNEMPEGADPLGPKNRLIAMTGALTGHRCPQYRQVHLGLQVSSDRRLGTVKLGRLLGGGLQEDWV